VKLLYQIDPGTPLRVSVEPDHNGGVADAHAIVAGINPDETVNLWVFPNGPRLRFLENVPVYPSETAARGDLADPATESPSAYVAWWPPGAAERDFAVTSAVVFFGDDVEDAQEQMVSDGQAGAASCSGEVTDIEHVHGIHVEGDATCTVDSVCTGTDGHQYPPAEPVDQPDAAAATA
jgi:hypothetical protein